MQVRISAFPWRRYFFEFLSIFFGVTMAFGLQRWNENRRDALAEQKTLIEVQNGLKLDLEDIALNMLGHRAGIRSGNHMRALLRGDSIANDTFLFSYENLLRDYISVQNKTGYESLKSRGLETVQNDSLRQAIINLYDVQYEIVEKLEENYYEIQFNESYFEPINSILVDHLQFDSMGRLTGVDQPLIVSDSERKTILSYIHRIEMNRNLLLYYYGVVEKHLNGLIRLIDEETST